MDNSSLNSHYFTNRDPCWAEWDREGTYSQVVWRSVRRRGRDTSSSSKRVKRLLPLPLMRTIWPRVSLEAMRVEFGEVVELRE